MSGSVFISMSLENWILNDDLRVVVTLRHDHTQMIIKFVANQIGKIVGA